MLKNYLPNNNYAKLSILFGVGSSVLFYITLKQYLRIRKYKHIPGPKRKGFIFLKEQKNLLYKINKIIFS